MFVALVMMTMFVFVLMFFMVRMLFGARLRALRALRARHDQHVRLYAHGLRARHDEHVCLMFVVLAMMSMFVMVLSFIVCPDFSCSSCSSWA